MNNRRDIRILAAHGESRSRNRLSQQLERWGFKYDIVSNGDDAIDLYYSHNRIYYDLVILDLKLPQVDGFETAKAIRTFEEDVSFFEMHCPKIAITTTSPNKSAALTKKVRGAGFIDYIVKPYDQRDLRLLIYLHLSSFWLMQQIKNKKRKTKMI